MQIAFVLYIRISTFLKSINQNLDQNRRISSKISTFFLEFQKSTPQFPFHLYFCK